MPTGIYIRINSRKQIKTCKTCSKKFKSYNNIQKYCSLNCSEQTKKQQKDYWYQKNKIKVLQREKIYRKTHKKQIKRWRLKNRKRLTNYYKEYKKEWWYKNKKRFLIKQRERYLKNKEKIKKRSRKWYKENKNKAKTRNYKYTKNKLKTNINLRIKKNLRTRLWFALKKNIKSKSTTKLLGCSIEQLKRHLESQFKLGMSWKNYGKWHIDHIKPCALFDLSKSNEQHKCFHYTNLQPLWAKENLSKSKLLEEQTCKIK